MKTTITKTELYQLQGLAFLSDRNFKEATAYRDGMLEILQIDKNKDGLGEERISDIMWGEGNLKKALKDLKIKIK